jgi:hypothetical protein
MTRIRLTALFACFLFATAAVAQFHQDPDPPSGPFGSCKYWWCYQHYGQTMCWGQGEPTGDYYKDCQVACDWGQCWCDFSYQCNRI